MPKARAVSMKVGQPETALAWDFIGILVKGCMSRNMNNENAFPLSLDFEGRHYKGTIEPASEKGPDGRPVHFGVIIDGKLFAYLCCGDLGWSEKNGSDQHPDLINAIGKYIFSYYE